MWQSRQEKRRLLFTKTSQRLSQIYFAKLYFIISSKKYMIVWKCAVEEKNTCFWMCTFSIGKWLGKMWILRSSAIFFQRENSACREEFLVNKVWWKILSWAFSNPEREREANKEVLCAIFIINNIIIIPSYLCSLLSFCLEREREKKNA